jgi:DNA replication licensing factor MCM2
MIESVENVEPAPGIPLLDHIRLPHIRTEIYNRFKNFLRTYVNKNGQSVYRDRIRRMCEANQSSFEIDYNILATVEKVRTLNSVLDVACESSRVHS